MCDDTYTRFETLSHTNIPLIAIQSSHAICQYICYYKTY